MAHFPSCTIFRPWILFRWFDSVFDDLPFRLFTIWIHQLLQPQKYIYTYIYTCICLIYNNFIYMCVCARASCMGRVIFIIILTCKISQCSHFPHILSKHQYSLSSMLRKSCKWYVWRGVYRDEDKQSFDVAPIKNSSCMAPSLVCQTLGVVGKYMWIGILGQRKGSCYLKWLHMFFVTDGGGGNHEDLFEEILQSWN